MQKRLDFAEIDITQTKILGAMGYGGHIPNKDVLEMVDTLIAETKKHCEPMYSYLFLDGMLQENTIQVAGTIFDTGTIITRSLRGSDQFVIFTATAGSRFQEWVEDLEKENDMLVRFIVDSIGSEIAEATADVMQLDVKKTCIAKGVKNTNRFSPGYCGWHVQEQQRLFPLLGEDVCGIRLTESSLMYPIKSVSGIIGVGQHTRCVDYGCNICDYKNCFRRKSL